MHTYDQLFVNPIDGVARIPKSVERLILTLPKIYASMRLTVGVTVLDFSAVTDGHVGNEELVPLPSSNRVRGVGGVMVVYMF
ncbi:hypothetical protein ACTXT7_004899 [Hymenolepis weldensis]